MVFDRSFQFGPLVSVPVYGVTGANYGIERPMKKFSQEVRLANASGARLEWLVGAFYTHEDGPYIVDSDAIDTTTLALAGPILDFNLPRTFDERAVFGAVTWHFTDRFDVQVGGRESRNRLRSPSYQFIGPYSIYALQSPSPYTYPATRSEADVFTYLVTPRFKVSEDLMVYGRLTSGYRPGAPNATVAPGVPLQFEPDDTRNYEIGVKADFLDHRLSLDASVYFIAWSDIQLNARNSNGIGYTANGGKAKSEGVELALTFRPTNGLTVAGWLSYDNAVLTEKFPASATVYGARDDRLPSTPERSGHLSLDQELPLWGNAAGFWGGEITYVGDRVSYFQATPLRQGLPSYVQTDLRAGLRYDTWTTHLFINNLTDRRGVINGGRGYLPANAFVYIQPRTIGLNLVKTF